MIEIKDRRFGCSKHNIDYRISCEECNEKWANFEKVTSAMIEDSQEKEVRNEKQMPVSRDR
jgi:transcriptional regulator NrdR family protein